MNRNICIKFDCFLEHSRTGRRGLRLDRSAEEQSAIYHRAECCVWDCSTGAGHARHRQIRKSRRRFPVARDQTADRLRRLSALHQRQRCRSTGESQSQARTMPAQNRQGE